ncbi:hypothetical protein JB92DRAFT_3097061 [Gautieria morchelliformis]|nr:hypothetical protein JB92DRAFT_3097061 [Gautieria morchelliformis]
MTTLQMLYEEVADLETTREQLLAQLKAVDKTLAADRVRILETENLNCNAGTSNLPCEILSKIFKAGLQLTPGHQQWEESWPPETHQLPFALLVSHVSHRWRIIALQTPGLWSYIDLSPCTSTIELLDIYLERSRGLLLDIRFGIPSYSDERIYRVFSAHFRRQLTTLIPHAARWRQLSIVLPEEFTKDLSVLADVCAPALKSILLGAFTDPSRISTLSAPLFSGGAPVLSSVKLHGYCVRVCRLPLASVTYLTLRGHTLTQEQVHMLFKPLHCLTHLYLQADQILCTNLPRIELPSVRTLCVCLTADHAAGALNCLDLPALEILTVVQDGAGDILAFVRSLHQTYPALRGLMLLGTSRGVSPVTPMLDFVAAFPNIEEVLVDYHLTSLLDALNAELAEGPPWPHLHTMAVTAPVPLSRGGTPIAGFMLPIIALIDRRVASGHAISHLTLSKDITGQVDQEQLQQLRGRVAVLKELPPVVRV